MHHTRDGDQESLTGRTRRLHASPRFNSAGRSRSWPARRVPFHTHTDGRTQLVSVSKRSMAICDNVANLSPPFAAGVECRALARLTCRAKAANLLGDLMYRFLCEHFLNRKAGYAQTDLAPSGAVAGPRVLLSARSNHSNIGPTRSVSISRANPACPSSISCVGRRPVEI